MKRLIVLLMASAPAGFLMKLAWAAPARPAPEALRGDLQRILSRPEFRQSRDEWLAALLTRLLSRLVQWWNDHITNPFAGLAATAPVLYWAVVALLAGLAVLLIYHIYVVLRSAFGTGRGRRKSESARPEPPPVSDPDTLLEQAEAAARAGRYAEALRYLYLALIHQLDRQDIVRYDVSRTNQEYVRQARAHPVIVGPLRDVSRLADRAWYGHYDLPQVEYERCRALVQTAWEEAEHAAAV